MKKQFIENIPNLAEAQHASFYSFLHKGISKLLQDIESSFLINDTINLNIKYANKILFAPNNLKLRGPFQSLEICKLKKASYSVQIYMPFYYLAKPKLLSKRGKKENMRALLIKQDCLIAEIPLITSEGNFLVDGCERVVINQIIRSPGVYFGFEHDIEQKKLIDIATIISDNGSWTKVSSLRNEPLISLEFPNAPQDEESIEKREEKQSFSIFHFLKFFKINLEEFLDCTKSGSTLYRKNVYIKNLKASKNLKEEELANFLKEKFYSAKEGLFSVGEIGRSKVNKRLGLNLPLNVTHLTVLDLLAIIETLLSRKHSSTFSEDDIDHIENKQLRSVGTFLEKQLRAGFLKTSSYEDSSPQGFAATKLLAALKKKLLVQKRRKRKITGKRKSKVVRHDFFFDAHAISSTIDDFFKTSQLSQFLDQTNSLAEITHKRKISLFGPNGLSRDHVNLAVRDIHPSQYARICPVETPEGQGAGLVLSLALFSRNNAQGGLETPYFKLKKGQLLQRRKMFYLDPTAESKVKVAFCETSVDSAGFLTKDTLSVKDNTNFSIEKSNKIDFLSVAATQLLSLAATLIPFVEHDDASRALMGANMQRQAVPLLYPQKMIVGTGFESIAGYGSDLVLKSFGEGQVLEANSSRILVVDKKQQKISYYLQKNLRSNQETLINQKPLVWEGEHIFAGQIIADGSSTLEGELAIGQNLAVAYMPWEGYNYEDAIVINERLVSDEVLTSVHIEEYETTLSNFVDELEIVKTKVKELPLELRQKLNANGIVKVGAYVRAGEILAIKVNLALDKISPDKRLYMAILNKEKIYEDTSFLVPSGCEGRVIEVRAVLQKQGGIRQKESTKHVETPELTKKEKELIKKEQKISKMKKGKSNDLFPLESEENFHLIKEVNAPIMVRFFIAQAKKIEAGDKLSGRHGNKGVISKILPSQDMPCLPNGEIIDILLNPLGVPSRMNAGQLFECLLGFAGSKLGKRFKVRPFDEVYGHEASRVLVNQKLKEASLEGGAPWIFSEAMPGKVLLQDGRTGEFFDNPITVGKSYILKLIHLVKKKIHARAIGPYATITEQPLAGKALEGGQRLGEMEVWALEAYGCSNTLHEMLTIKSDDIEGRENMYDSLLKNDVFERPQPTISETFLVLIRELNSLGLDFELVKMEETTTSITKTFCNIFNEVESRLKLRALYKAKIDEDFRLKRNIYLAKVSADAKEKEQTKMLQIYFEKWDLLKKQKKKDEK